MTYNNIPFGIKPIEFDRYISPDGQEYHFNNAIDKFVIAGVTGSGFPPIVYRTQRGPFQHGETPLGMTLQPRIIQLLHRRNGTGRQDYWDNRADLLDMLRPNRLTVDEFVPGVLRKIMPDRTKRDICVFLQTGLQFQGTRQGEWSEWDIQEPLQFIAHDPTFFDPDLQSTEFGLDTTSSDLEFPFEFTFAFISSANTANNSVTYSGTWETYPTIIIQGPMRNPIIRNLTTDDKIEFKALTIGAGRTITISLQYGNKTIVDDLGNNLIGSLSSDSDLAAFRLVPAPTAPNGVNEIGVAGSNLSSASFVKMQWFTRYIGI